MLTNVEIAAYWEKSGVDQRRLPVPTEEEEMLGVIILRRNGGEANPSFSGSQKVLRTFLGADPRITKMKVF